MCPTLKYWEKLQEFGVTLKSPIKRKMHPGTDVANGTVCSSQIFPERQSLPYTLKLSTGQELVKLRRVKHVIKVLSYCRCEPVWNRGRNENETTNDDTENDINANNSENETNSDIPEHETNTEHQENDGMNENEAEDRHMDGANGDDDNMEQSDDDDDNTAKSDVSDEKQMSGVDNDELDLMTEDEHSNKQETVNVDNKMHKKGGSSPSKLKPQPIPRGPNLTDTVGKNTEVDGSKGS
ncbi:unnamed protein product [Mytilus coruscus]|uniref:Uncharacterized protein n=1 Tax=Mytilus coruscus TaxID=42192 RepID=A0A6J8ESP1_MYTCO|nr:unnamed protein product [Mytilus coruscus]